MTRFLPFLLAIFMLTIITSAFDEIDENDEISEMVFSNSMAEAYAYPEERRNNKRKMKNKKKAKKNKNKNKKHRGQGKKCGRIDDTTCLANLEEAMDFEGSVVANFLAQKARALNWMKLVGNKKMKNANFASATASMLEALGGDADAPKCSMSAAKLSFRSADEALTNFNTLKNCSISIQSECMVANGTVDEMALDSCEVELRAIKTKNEECCKAEAEEKCACFQEAMTLVKAAKNGSCKQLAKDANKAMKERKTACLGEFKECKKAEDAASGFINVCLGGTMRI